MIKVVKKILEKINLIGIAMMITAQAAFADSIQDVTAWIIGLGSGVTILMVIYCLLRRNMADEMDHKKWQTRMIVSLISGVGIVVASGVIKALVSYYQ